MDIIWHGITRTETLHKGEAKIRHALADVVVKEKRTQN
jgi:hypothetical protein